MYSGQPESDRSPAYIDVRCWHYDVVSEIEKAELRKCVPKWIAAAFGDSDTTCSKMMVSSQKHGGQISTMSVVAVKHGRQQNKGIQYPWWIWHSHG